MYLVNILTGEIHGRNDFVLVELDADAKRLRDLIERTNKAERGKSFSEASGLEEELCDTISKLEVKKEE